MRRHVLVLVILTVGCFLLIQFYRSQHVIVRISDLLTQTYPQTVLDYSSLLPVQSPVGRSLGQKTVKFRLTDEERREFAQWKRHRTDSNDTSCFAFCQKGQHPFEFKPKTQDAFFQSLAIHLNTTVKALVAELEAPGTTLPPNSHLNAVVELIKEGGGTEPREGRHRPLDICQSDERAAIIIPYRKRASNLLYFMYYIHLFLQYQLRDYRIILAQQGEPKKFRRANLFNAAVTELLLHRPVAERPDCLIFHDIDKLPVSKNATLRCELDPIQLARQLVNEDGAVIQAYYEEFMGAATMLSRWTYFLLNGMSNAFSGWGGEDDDFRIRTQLTHIKTQKRSPADGSFLSLDHHKDIDYDNDRLSKLRMETVKNNLMNNGLYQVEYKLDARSSHALMEVFSFSFP